MSKYLIVFYCPFFLWWSEVMKCLHDAVRWGEWHRPYDLALVCYWPSDDTSGGRSPASGLLLTEDERGLLCLQKLPLDTSFFVVKETLEYHFINTGIWHIKDNSLYSVLYLYLRVEMGQRITRSTNLMREKYCIVRIISGKTSLLWEDSPELYCGRWAAGHRPVDRRT